MLSTNGILAGGFEPQSLVMFEAPQGARAVITAGEVREVCISATAHTTGAAPFTNGVVLQLVSGEPGGFDSTIHGWGPGCGAPEFSAAVPRRSLSGIAVTADGAVWATELGASQNQLVQIDLDDGAVLRAISIPPKTVLHDIDGQGFFYLLDGRACTANGGTCTVRILSPAGEPVSDFVLPERTLTRGIRVAPDGHVWEGSASLKQFLPDGTLVNEFFAQGLSSPAFESPTEIWVSTERGESVDGEGDGVFALKWSTDGVLLEEIEIPFPAFTVAPKYLVFVPPAPRGSAVEVGSGGDGCQVGRQSSSAGSWLSWLLFALYLCAARPRRTSTQPAADTRSSGSEKH